MPDNDKNNKCGLCAPKEENSYHTAVGGKTRCLVCQAMLTHEKMILFCVDSIQF